VLASQFGKKTVVIDCNLTNPHLALYLGGLSSWPVTLNHVLRNEAIIDQAMYEHSSQLKIIPASFEMHDLRRMNMYRLRSRIKSAFEGHEAEVVILDSAPGLNRESMLTMRCADEVVFVATPHTPSIVDINKCCQMLNDEKDAKPVGIILNRIKKRSYELGSGEITKFTGLPVIAEIPESDAVLKSTNFKTPVVVMNPNDSASRAFARAAGAITGEELPVTSTPGFWSSLFGRFRR
jgi:MinD-like ATPase involved in chromosome partitioning or flagellar assembly